MDSNLVSLGMLREFKRRMSSQKPFQVRSKHYNYRIGIFECQLPVSHNLPTYQANNKTYDKYYSEWLKIFQKFAMKKVSVLDIGANVGDTLLYILSYLDCQITAVEASPYFFEYLTKNVSKNNLEEFVDSHKIALVLPEITSEFVYLYNDSSTASTTIGRQPNHQNVETVKTVELTKFLLESNKEYDLIKIDIDANDYAYVSKLISDPHAMNAIICFEFDPLNLHTNLIEEAWELFSRLETLEYSALIVDNHGRTMMSGKNLKETLSHLGNWLKLQQESGNQHVHYFDIWIFPPKKVEIFAEITRSLFIRK